MSWNSSNGEETTIQDNAPFSDQSKIISNALREADRVMKNANYVFSSKSAATVDERTHNDDNGSESSSYDETTDIAIRKGVDARIRESTYNEPTTGLNKSPLNLKENDIQFQIIADVIVSKYEHFLKTGTKTFSVSIVDKQQLDRMVARDNFVEAVRFRLHSCPEDSQKQIHVLTRKCRALGLHRLGNQNLLFAPAGTVIEIESTPSTEKGTYNPAGQDNVASKSGTTNRVSTDAIGKQQLLAELREASNLMASSVTPEAAQFWRKHVVDLQTRLRNLHDKSEAPNTSAEMKIESCSNVTARETEPCHHIADKAATEPFENVQLRESEKLCCQNDQFFAGLNDTTTHIAPARDQTSQQTSWPESQTCMNTRSEPATNALDPQLQGLPVVDVVSPANLPDGYTFEAEIDGCRFMATVPAGGVRKGQTFTCYMRDLEKLDSDIPVGRWRDGLFGCLNHGVQHPMFLNSFFCPIFALSQIMTRMGADFMGLPARDIPRKGMGSTMGQTTTISAFWIMLNTLILYGVYYKLKQEVPISGADIAAFLLVNAGMFVYIVYAASNTRLLIRNKYRIDDVVCGDLEDIVCSALCMPCVVSQMGRHTVSYEDHKGVCCSDTGLEPGVEGDITARRHVGSYRVW